MTRSFVIAANVAFWLFVGTCTGLANVPPDLGVSGAAVGLAVSMLAFTRQREFMTTACIAALPFLCRYVIKPALLGQSDQHTLSQLYSALTTPTVFIVLSVFSAIVSCMHAIKWGYTVTD